MTETTIALDRASVRRSDDDGHMHVSLTPISKANVCGYLGREIPDWQSLGLKADRIYKMWRHPEELEKAADSFNGKPLLFGHNPVSAAKHDHDRTVGAVSGVQWKPPFLMATLDIWPSKAIDAIDSGEHEELSSAYAYKADMAAGRTPDGEQYDGIMRNIRGNHVAMVKEGRAGSDVRVLDAKPRSLKETFPMPKTAVLSRTADVARGALMAYAKPRLAQDAKIDLQPILKGVTAKNLKAKASTIAKAFDAAVRPKLGQDADMDQADVQAVVEEVAELMKSESDDIAAAVADPDPAAAPDPDGNDAPDMDALMSYLGGVLTDEQMAKVKSMMGKGDDDDGAEDRRKKGLPAAPSAQDSDKDKVPVITKPAMDAAIAQARKDAATDAMKQANAIRDAERFVRPYVGEIAMACDSAEAVHRAALDILKVKHEGKHPDALADLVEVHGQAIKAKAEPRRHLAQDAAPSGITYDAKSFPNSSRLK
jgi:hypothetical protein